MNTDEHPTVEVSAESDHDPAGDDDTTTTHSIDDISDPQTRSHQARACRRCAVISHTDSATCPACGARYASRDIRTPLLRAAVAAAIAIPLIVGAFLFGQSTRITKQQAARHESATVAAFSKRQKMKTHNLLLRQEKKLKKVFNKRAKKRAEKAYKSGQSAGYSSGHSAGYNSGYDQGGSDGIDAGIDLGACLADPYYC